MAIIQGTGKFEKLMICQKWATNELLEKCPNSLASCHGRYFGFDNLQCTLRETASYIKIIGDIMRLQYFKTFIQVAALFLVVPFCLFFDNPSAHAQEENIAIL